jgi:hypothetical protein
MWAGKNTQIFSIHVFLFFVKQSTDHNIINTASNDLLIKCQSCIKYPDLKYEFSGQKSTSSKLYENTLKLKEVIM